MSEEPLFESSPAAPATTQAPGTYEHALYALHHDAGVAENLFARLSKTDVAKLLKPLQCKRTEEATALYPLRVSQQTVAFNIKDLATDPKDESLVPYAHMLRAIVGLTADSVLKSAAGKSIILVGSLGVRVQNIGGGHFSFALKQKWSFANG